MTMTTNMNLESNPGSLDRDGKFRVVTIVSSALGTGCLLSSLVIVQPDANGLGFVWNNWAIPAFALGGLLSVLFWRLVFRLADRRGDEAIARRKLHLASFALLVMAFGAFIYPLRFVNPERRTDVLIGLTMAIIALSTVGMLIRTVVKWLETEID